MDSKSKLQKDLPESDLPTAYQRSHSETTFCHQSENERLAKEITRLNGEMTELGRFYNILYEQTEEIHRERVEYVETHLGITYEQFRSKYKEIYPAWLAKNQ